MSDVLLGSSFFIMLSCSRKDLLACMALPRLLFLLLSPTVPEGLGISKAH